MGDSLVHIEAVNKSYKGKSVVRDIHLRAERGEIIALCGGNGAGKSTLLRMVAGVIRPTSGTIAVDGVRWEDDRRAYAARIGYMPDDYRFSAGLTAMETMAFWAKLRGLDAARAAELLALVGLADTGGKPVSAFSKGMRQRVLFAQALLAQPPLIVMDEPTNGLDPYWIETFVRLVRQAAAGGQTVLFSTHQLQVAEALADRILFVRDGAAAFCGTIGDVRSELGADGLLEAFGELSGLRSL